MTGKLILTAHWLPSALSEIVSALFAEFGYAVWWQIGQIASMPLLEHQKSGRWLIPRYFTQNLAIFDLFGQLTTFYPCPYAFCAMNKVPVGVARHKVA